jgi:hypothetical protein
VNFNCLSIGFSPNDVWTSAYVRFRTLLTGQPTGRSRPAPAGNRMSCSAHRGSQADRQKATFADLSVGTKRLI